MNITVHTLAYNEELRIQFMIDHYRSRFPNCHIVIYDNSSTDKTVEIARKNNCEIRHYDSGNTLNDGLHMNIKNTCWKDAKTDWVLVCDLDELLDITEQELEYEESIGTTIIKPEAWTIVNLEDNYDFKAMKYGMRDGGYDKKVLFNKKFIKSINYDVGCHNANPIGTVKFNDKSYILYHYRDIHPDFIVNRSKSTTQRLSQANKQHGWGIQCTRSENELRENFERLKKMAIKVPVRYKKMDITVYTVTYNEELMLPFMINHYRSRFPNCHIVVYDNQSTDRTVEIAKENNCEIRYYNSGDKHDELMMFNTKNTCWKDAKTDWVLVCDTDELLDINEEQLIEEDSSGVTKIKSECWHMVNRENNTNFESITYGYRNASGPNGLVYDKDLLFNKKYVEINYEGAGCHSANSRGLVKNSNKKYKLLHYKYCNEDIFVTKRAVVNLQRLNPRDDKHGWGNECNKGRDELRKEYLYVRNNSVKVIESKKHFYQNIQGWFNYQSLYSDVVSKLPDNSHIVEVGIWKGASTAYLAIEIFESKKNIKVDAVDIWEDYNMFEKFIKDMEPVKHIVTPIRLSSVNASKLYNDKSLDFVFIDANTTYESTKEDIMAWLPKIKDGGWIGGHDYNHPILPEISRAVNEIFDKSKILTIKGTFDPKTPNNQHIGINNDSWLVNLK